ncbi:MAG: hypothetical protein ACP5D2_00180 [Candidatus Nanoarchaeia archaeon]
MSLVDIVAKPVSECKENVSDEEVEHILKEEFDGMWEDGKYFYKTIIALKIKYESELDINGRPCWIGLLAQAVKEGGDYRHKRATQRIAQLYGYCIPSWL